MGNFQAYIINGINGIQGAFISGVSGSTTIGQLMDNDFAPFTALGNAIMTRGTTNALPNITLVFAAVLVFFAQGILFAIGLGWALAF